MSHDTPVSFADDALAAILASTGEGLLAFDEGGVCRYVSKRAADVFGVSPEHLVGRPASEVWDELAEASDQPAQFLEVVRGNDAGKPVAVLGEVDVARPGVRRLTWTTYPIAARGEGRLVVVRDVTRERHHLRTNAQLQARIEELSRTDALTGFLHARTFREELEREHARSARANDSFALLRVDIDNLKGINDQHGRGFGDAVLKGVAACLRRARRDYDVVARLDGDEFAALLPGGTAVAAKTVAERLVSSVAAYDFGLPGLKVTASVGASVWLPGSEEGPAVILAKTGEAVKQALAKGPSSVVVIVG